MVGSFCLREADKAELGYSNEAGAGAEGRLSM
jgi:hypothetical protein